MSNRDRDMVEVFHALKEGGNTSDRSKSNKINEPDQKEKPEVCNEIFTELKIAREKWARIEKGIEGINRTINTTKTKVENLKLLVEQVEGLAIRCDKIEERVTRLDGERTEVINEVKEWLKQKDNNEEEEKELKKKLLSAIESKEKNVLIIGYRTSSLGPESEIDCLLAKILKEGINTGKIQGLQTLLCQGWWQWRKTQSDNSELSDKRVKERISVEHYWWPYHHH